MSKKRIAEVAEILLDYAETGRTFQGCSVMSIPPASYIDPAQATSEIDLIFKRVPLMLALSCEMPVSGDYKTIEAAGVPVLMVRDKLGVMRAFLNVCAHRWAPIAEGTGRCTRFTCRFHGWSYALDGQLVGVADQAKFGEIDRAKHGLTELPCEERQGMVFVGLTPRIVLEIDRYYGGFLEEFADAGLRDWSFLGARVIDGPNWKLTLNNFFESYHFATLHSKTVSRDLMPNMTHYDAFGPHFRISLTFQSIRELRQLPRDQWSEMEGQKFGFIRFLFPNVTGYFAPPQSVSLFTQTFPGSTPDKSRTILLYARRRPPSDESDSAQLQSEIDYVTNDITDKEDVAIGLEIQKRLASGAYPGLLYGRNERGNQYFHEWVNWYLARSPGAPTPVM